MNKFVVIIVIVVVAVIALGAAGYVYAQAPTPQAPVPGTGYGYGMMSGRGAGGGMMAGQASVAGDQDGPLHDGMIAVYSQKLGIAVDDLNARLTKGETMAQIAYSKGLTAAQFSALMIDARTQAIGQAVKDGTLTQAQADWMKQRGSGMLTQASGTRTGMMGRGGMGMRGTGQGQFANPACPYFPQNQP